jgi:hypothetical protein
VRSTKNLGSLLPLDKSRFMVRNWLAECKLKLNNWVYWSYILSLLEVLPRQEIHPSLHKLNQWIVCQSVISFVSWIRTSEIPWTSKYVSARVIYATGSSPSTEAPPSSQRDGILLETNEQSQTHSTALWCSPNIHRTIHQCYQRFPHCINPRLQTVLHSRDSAIHFRWHQK